MDKIHLSEDFLQFIVESPTKYHAIANIQQRLQKDGYTELSINQKWELKPQGKYYIIQDEAAMIAFQLGVDLLGDGIHMICSHSDSPTLKIKPNAIIPDNEHIKLNIQSYGWPQLHSWFDRPLSIAGRVTLKGERIFQPISRLIDFKDPILFIPSLSFHLNKGNSGASISVQQEMPPIMGNKDKDKPAIFNSLIADKLNTEQSDILDYELYLYSVEKGRLVGLNKDFIVSPKQDDLIMVYASCHALVHAKESKKTKMIVLFDAEEETNSTLGAADTPFLRDVITKIVESQQGSNDDIIQVINRSFAISLDSDHASHPNYKDKRDSNCSAIINQGISIKYDARMRYATTAVTSAIFQEICNQASIPFQKSAPHSDFPSGGTVSAFMETQLAISCVEIGIPTWSLHSTYESCGTEDFFNLARLLEFFCSLNE